MIPNTALSSVLAGLVLCAVAPSAQAQTQPEPRWSFDLGAATDNRSKNVSKTGNDGHIFGSATWESGDRRFYAGPSFEGVQSAGSNVELKLSTGFAPEAYGFEWDFNITYLNRVDADSGFDEDGLELTADMRRAIGPAWGNLQVQYAPDATGDTRSFVWVEASAGWEFSNRLSASAGIGRREQVGAPDYTGWNAGLTWGLTDKVDVDLRYYDTDAHSEGETYRDAIVAEVVYAF